MMVYQLCLLESSNDYRLGSKVIVEDHGCTRCGLTLKELYQAAREEQTGIVT